jgi:NAD(P)-dependent dehydrogenase (short-subunit alcohol dehydrogenase family)
LSGAVVITGASSGIGEALEAVAARCGPQALALVADCGKREDARRSSPASSNRGSPTSTLNPDCASRLPDTTRH